MVYKKVKMDTIQLKQELINLEANFCSGLGDPTRLLVLYSLYEGQKNVTELMELLKISQPNISRHLKILREKDLVKFSKSGTTVTYELTDPRIIEALDLLREIMRDQMILRSEIVIKSIL